MIGQASKLFLSTNDGSNKEIMQAAVGGQLAEDIVLANQQKNEDRRKEKADKRKNEHQDGKFISTTNVMHQIVKEEDSSVKGEEEGIELRERESFSESFRRSSIATIAPGEVPNMWSKDFIGLYAHYAASGLLYGTTGTLIPFCAYTYNGESNVCANARSIMTFAYNFKIWYAILTDSYRPFGLRRKPWMIGGWIFVLLLHLFLAIAADQLSVTSWLITLLFTQVFLMFSDAPADGYSVELGQLESKEERGQILATGQLISFIFCIVAGVIQTFLLNGPATNDSDCEISFDHCWSWGLTINQYYALLFVLTFILAIPIIWLKELPNENIPQHSFVHFLEELWDTLQNPTTFYLLIFVIGSTALTGFTNNCGITLQYYVIKLSSFQAGIDTITSYLTLVGGMYLFQKYLINYNWRYTQYASTLLSALLGLIWIAPYYNSSGTMNPWFTIFIDLDNSFALGIIEVLYAMALIELAKKGQEATIYELVCTAGYAAYTLNAVISTQLLTPTHSVACDDDHGDCPSDTVDVSSRDKYYDSNGPERFTVYTLVLTGISIAAVFIFTPFLPATKEECHEWKEAGERTGNSALRGKLSMLLAASMILYGSVAAILLVNTQTSCLPFVGGSGC